MMYSGAICMASHYYTIISAMQIYFSNGHYA